MDPITLPVSGKSVTLRKLKGRDFLEARLPMRDKEDNVEYGFALMAKRCQFDGVQAVLEDVLALDEDDLAVLQKALGSMGNPTPASTPTP